MMNMKLLAVLTPPSIYHSASGFSDQISRHLPENCLLFSSNVLLLVSLTVPVMIIHQLQLIVYGKTACQMDFFKKSKTNWMNDQNQSIPQTCWMLPNKLKCIIKKSSVCLIILPPKIWRPKFTSKYKTPDYANDIDDGIFDHVAFGNFVFSPTT